MNIVVLIGIVITLVTGIPVLLQLLKLRVCVPQGGAPTRTAPPRGGGGGGGGGGGERRATARTWRLGWRGLSMGATKEETLLRKRLLKLSREI